MTPAATFVVVGARLHRHGGRRAGTAVDRDGRRGPRNCADSGSAGSCWIFAPKVLPEFDPRLSRAAGRLLRALPSLRRVQSRRPGLALIEGEHRAARGTVCEGSARGFYTSTP